MPLLLYICAELEHLIQALAIIPRKLCERRGHYTREVFKNAAFVTLQVCYTCLALLQVIELLLGRLAELIQFPKLCAQLIKSDVPLGCHVLKARALAVGFGELVQPSLDLPLRVTPEPIALPLYHLVQACA